MGGAYGRGIWEGHMGGAYGRGIWEGHMGGAYGRGETDYRQLYNAPENDHGLLMPVILILIYV